MGLLIDERRRPDFRDVFGSLCRNSQRIACAVTSIRLTTVDLSPEEIAHLRSFRVLVAELNALRLDREARTLSMERGRGATVALLLDLLAAGRLEIRSAPLGGWAPDYSVFSSDYGRAAVLTGLHWFERPYPHRGPALASLHTGDAALEALQRFDELWMAAHDVGPAISTLLSRAVGPSAREPAIPR